MMRAPLIVALAIGLCGCGSTGTEQRTAAAASCEAMYSDQPADAVARANCLNDVDLARSRQTGNSKLTYMIVGKRSELAELQASGKITAAQAEQQMADFRSRVGGDQMDRPQPSGMERALDNTGKALRCVTISMLSSECKQ